jgi:hypothetical protein
MKRHFLQLVGIYISHELLYINRFFWLKAKYFVAAIRWIMSAIFRRKKKKCANCCHKYYRLNLTLGPFSQRQLCKPIIMSPYSSAETYVCFPSTKNMVSVVVRTHHWPDTCRNHHHHHHHNECTLSISTCVKGKAHPLDMQTLLGVGCGVTTHSHPRR